jgi:TPP-dependent trihydroxycyclohexane-1,2-dione (THcHDO) dehydratase
MKRRYGVEPYKNWGSLPPQLQKVWDTPEVDCNHHVAEEAPPFADPGRCGTWMEQFQLAPFRSWGSTPPDIQKIWDASDCNHKVCQYMKDRYGVVPYHNWGSLPGNLQRVWDTPEVDCNHHVQ